MSNIKIGIIGSGNIVTEHLKVLRDNKFFKIYGIVSKTNKNSFIIADNFKIKKVYKNIMEMCNDKNIDALVILVSASSTFEVLSKIIPFKKPFFVEKPSGLDFKESKKLLKLIKKYKNLNMVGYNRRFYSIFEKGLKIINKKGRLLGVTIEGHERMWKIKNIIDSKNIKNWIYANSSHTIDLIRFFGGEIKRITNVKTRLIEKNNDQFVMIFETNKNIIGSYTSHWYSPGSWNVKLYGEKVSVIFDPLEKGYWIDENFKKREIFPDKKDIKYKAGFFNQMKSFQNLLQTKKNKWPSQSIIESHKTMKIINTLITN